LKIIKILPKTSKKRKEVDFLQYFKCKHVFLLDPSERYHKNIFYNVVLVNKPSVVLQVMAEKTPSKTIYRLCGP